MNVINDYIRGTTLSKEHTLLNRIEITKSEKERRLLEELYSRDQYVATQLPIRTVDVQLQEIRSLDILVILP
ncbi:hypothetical protein GHT06_016684 [Daphnia sinensis]|uniref:Uncharacterized protein n=1 Tax=Daphnia sinensis TaxID=1820382 RepID=A0AAD5PVC6_9CRUS|nr:hypothetical protein GHT06_016684 [Daphnia sinensis]